MRLPGGKHKNDGYLPKHPQDYTIGGALSIYDGIADTAGLQEEPGMLRRPDLRRGGEPRHPRPSLARFTPHSTPDSISALRRFNWDPTFDYRKWGGPRREMRVDTRFTFYW